MPKKPLDTSLLMERSFTWYFQLRLLSVFTPRYLKLSEGYRILPHSFIFKSPSNLLCFRFKNHQLGFFTLSEFLWAFKQLTRCFNSALTSLFNFFIDLLIHNRSLSWAKWWTLKKFVAWLRSFIFNKKRRGSSTDPWETPQFIAAKPESKPFLDTYWLRLDR